MNTRDTLATLGLAILAGMALPGCKTPATPTGEQPVKETAAKTSRANLPTQERFYCDEHRDLCIELGLRGYAGASVLLDKTQGWGLLEAFCEAGDMDACSQMASALDAELLVAEIDEDKKFSTSTGLSQEEAMARVLELDQKIMTTLAGSCDAGNPPYPCSLLLRAKLRDFYNQENVGAPKEDAELVALFAKGEAMCTDSKEDFQEVCAFTATFLSLIAVTDEERNNAKVFDERAWTAPKEPCTTDLTPYMSARCVGQENRVEAATAACQRGDELGCADLVDHHSEEILNTEAEMTIHENFIMALLDLEEMPEDLSTLTPEQTAKIETPLGMYTSALEKVTAARIERAEAHRPGCIEAKVPEICASWKSGCQDEKLATTPSCKGSP